MSPLLRTQAHKHTFTQKKTIHRSFNPFFTHTVIISPEVSSRRVWRSEKRLAATQHCQEFEHMVNQPHILLGTFNDSIMIDHRQFELVIRIIIPFPFSLHTFMLFLYFPNFTVAKQHPEGGDVVPDGHPLLSVNWRLHTNSSNMTRLKPG